MEEFKSFLNGYEIFFQDYGYNFCFDVDKDLVHMFRIHKYNCPVREYSHTTGSVINI